MISAPLSTRLLPLRFTSVSHETIAWNKQCLCRFHYAFLSFSLPFHVPSLKAAVRRRSVSTVTPDPPLVLQLTRLHTLVPLSCHNPPYAIVRRCLVSPALRTLSCQSLGIGNSICVVTPAIDCSLNLLIGVSRLHPTPCSVCIRRVKPVCRLTVYFGFSLFG